MNNMIKTKVKPVKSILVLSFFMVLLLVFLPLTAAAEEMNGENAVTIYVSSTGSDSNDGSSSTVAVKTMEKALELVPEGGTIRILDVADTKQPELDEPLCITNNERKVHCSRDGDC